MSMSDKNALVEIACVHHTSVQNKYFISLSRSIIEMALTHADAQICTNRQICIHTYIHI